MSHASTEPPDLLIRRCTVRVVRRGGWSWGPEPAALATAAARALPALIAEQLAGLVRERAADGATRQAPVKVKLRLSLAELAALARGVPAGASLPPRHASIGPVHAHADIASLPPALSAAVRRAVVAALSAPELAAGWVEVAEPRAPATASLAAADAPSPVQADAALLATMCGWLDAGSLALHLASADDAILDGWQRLLLAVDAAPASRPAGVTDADVERVVVAAAVALAHAPRRRVAEARLTVAVAAHRALGVHAVDPALRAAIDARLPASAAAPPATALPPRAAPPPGRPGRALAPGDERHIASALPFLALGALARLGWLGASAAFLHADGSAGPAMLAAFATALAHKLVAAPERGWRRSSDAIAVAACFSGRAEPLADAALVALAAHLEGRTAALDAAVRRPFLDGHVPGDPLLLTRARHAERDGWLLAEARGAFPLAWAPEPSLLAPLTAARAAPPASVATSPDPLAAERILVPAADATPAVLAYLERAGRAFITDAAPARGEPWRALPGEPAPRLYANPRGLALGAAPGEARALAACADRITAAWHAVAVDRPAAPRAPERGLDASLSLAAALALADLAWRLFHTRELTDARLALDRFADLDAHVRVTPDEVRVRLPLGRRHQHLHEHGLLANIPRVPWWDGRTVVFSGG